MATDKERWIIEKFNYDVNLSIERNQIHKENILNSRRGFYGGIKSKRLNLSNGSWITGSCLPEEKNIHKDELDKNFSDIEWNLARKLGEPLIANVVKPFIESRQNVAVEADTDRNVLKVKVLNSMLNYFNDKQFERSKFIKKFVRNAVVDGVAYGSVGEEYRSNSYSIEIEKDLYDKIKKSTDEKKVKVENVGGKYFLKDTSNDYRMLTKKVLDPLSIHFDPLNEEIEKKSFFIEMENMSLDRMIEEFDLDSKEIKILINTSKESKYTEDKVLSNRLHTQEYNKRYGGGINRDKYSSIEFTVYKYWTKLEIPKAYNSNVYKDNRMHRVILATPKYVDNQFYGIPNETEILRIEESPFTFNHVPFFRANGFEGENSEWGDSITVFTMDLENVETKLLNLIIDNIANGNVNRWFVRKGMLDEENQKRLQANASYIELKRNVQGKIEDNMYQGKFNQIPQSVFSLLGILDNQSEETTGVNKTMTGAMGSNLSASSSNFSAGLSLAQTRTAMIIENIKDGLIDMMTMWSAMTVTSFTEEEIKKITNIDISAELFKYARDKATILLQGIDVDKDDLRKIVEQIIKEERTEYYDLNINFDINIKVASEAEKNLISEKILRYIQQAESLKQVIPDDVLREFSATFADNLGLGHIVNKVRNAKQASDPLREQLSQLQIAKEAAEVEERKANASKSIALAENSKARTDNLRARTEKLKRETEGSIDGKNLANKEKAIDIETRLMEREAGMQLQEQGVDINDINIFQ